MRMLTPSPEDPSHWSIMRIVLLALLIVALPVHASAQEARSSFAVSQPSPPDPAPAPPTVPELDRSLSSATAPEGLARQLLRAVGGAAVGAWVGYMASQVAVGDWDDDRGIDRGSWTAGGAAIGVTVGLTIPAGRVPPRASNESPVDRRSGRNVLTREQIQKAQSGNLYEVIQSLRPEWLQTRGTGSMRETARGSAEGIGGEINVRPGIPAIRTYLDGSRLGDVDALRTVDAGMIGEARFLSPAEATQRWGAGHLHGAILVLTASVQ